MERKIIDLEIVDDLEGSGVDAIALVDSPAIEKNFMYFRAEQFVEPKAGESQSDYMSRCVPVLIGEGKDQDQAVAICISTYENMSKDFVYDAFADYPWDECIADQKAKGLSEESANNICGWIRANMAETSFTDYPEAAKENAKRALAYAEANGWGDCGTPVGKIRANQLANGEPISLDTISRMASFERHRQNSTTPYGEGCGKLMWDAWGGDEGIAWAQRKLEQEQKLSMEFAKVSFDFDDTLSTEAGLALAMKHKRNGDTLYIISARNNVGQDMLARASKLGIPKDRIFATGSNLAKVAKVRELGISKHIDNNADVVRSLSGIGEKFEIDTSGLAPYTDQTGPLKKKAVGLAAVEDLKVGDEVSWKTAETNPRGKITEIVKDSKTVPGTDFKIEGTEQDPGYIIEIYEEVDGEWKPTGKYVGRKADSILKNVELADENKAVGTYGFAKMMFADEEKMELVGPVAVPDMEIPRRDEKTKEIYFVRFSKEVVCKMAEKFMREQRLSENNIQHVDNADAGSYVFESWIVESPEDKANSVYGLDVPVGTWMVKMRVTNPQTWAKVKSGELRGFSLQGNFLSQEEYEAYLKDKKMYEDLVKLVKTF